MRQQTLREQLNGGADIDFSSGDFHPNDVATLLKSFLGELPEPLLTHRHLHAHLKITELTLFDDQGNKTSAPDKERQIEALQLLLMLLPTANRTLLKLLLDLLYHTAKQQDKNKMSAHNLALMFAPHVIWPKNMNASDLQENLKKLNSGMAFLIKHSQKIFRLGKQSTPGTPGSANTTPTSKKHGRSRSFGGLIKKKVLGNHPAADRRGRHVSPPGKENIISDPCDPCLSIL
ncbi:rho GTPase-activating protein 19-like [Labeo rohita]|uniref:Rho GTPase-activating protein 19-like n=1 Tax=Labeo rohita TaxID=84645 RepID=A0A498L7H0_LABRO|nr:rho GTPase-activating protein 19-like [Labeo rohita]